MTIETVRLSQDAKDRLSRLKRRTGIRQWNTLCRWALCLSLAEESIPRQVNIPTDSNVEMDWRTFTGAVHGNVLLALLRARCLADNLPHDDETLSRQFKLHLHRGIAYLSAPWRVQNLSELLTLVIDDEERK